MKRIDQATRQRILDSVDIVDVVGDFVKLKRRGANWVGLCPFHNERTPSFSVNKAKGICKCFSCGKGGSAVNFLMELEQMTFNEALRYLAKKYGIEIVERELSAEEQQQETDRQSLMAVNDFAMRQYEHNLKETAEGRDVGLAYFRHRGINDAMIDRFHLGWALEGWDNLYKQATSKGYSEKYLLQSGLCKKTERGRVIDLLSSRVIYPIFSLSGKVLAFGGRTLRNDKSTPKYVNSPETDIYKKKSELYGLYQARSAINRKDKCILVEGYMDVISMHQSGIENVVASSGTSLTEQQITLIHRFTDNVTVVYDADPAGIKASLRGIDMLLMQGLNVRVLQLPEGDDPDSFAQSHSSTETEEYFNTHEIDFITFKTRILLKDASDNPIRRSEVITDIVRSISVIPSEIARMVYIGECSQMLKIDEGVLRRQMVEFRNKNLLKMRQDAQREAEHAKLDQMEADEAAQAAINQVSAPSQPKLAAAYLRPFEAELLRYVVRYGMMPLCENYDDNGNPSGWLTVLQYVAADLAMDEVTIQNPDINLLMQSALSLLDGWEADLAANAVEIERALKHMEAQEHEQIRLTASNSQEIDIRENRLKERLESERMRMDNEFRTGYIAGTLINDPDDSIRALATDMVSEKYVLSKIHTKYAKVDTEADRLPELVARALYELKDAILECRIRALRSQIKEAANDPERLKRIMEQQLELSRLKAEFAKYLGDRIVAPRK